MNNMEQEEQHDGCFEKKKEIKKRVQIN